MKKILIFLFFLPQLILLASDDINVLSYFAVENTIDGQPLINKTNVIHFYPVFVFREEIESVKIVTYIQDKDGIKRDAESIENGRYWKAVLPPMKLGHTIRRIEAEVTMKLPENIILMVKEMQDSISNISNKFNDATDITFVTFRQNMDDLNTQIKLCSKDLAKFRSINLNKFQTNINIINQLCTDISDKWRNKNPENLDALDTRTQELLKKIYDEFQNKQELIEIFNKQLICCLKEIQENNRELCCCLEDLEEIKKYAKGAKWSENFKENIFDICKLIEDTNSNKVRDFIKDINSKINSINFNLEAMIKAINSMSELINEKKKLDEKIKPLISDNMLSSLDRFKQFDLTLKKYIITKLEHQDLLKKNIYDEIKDTNLTGPSIRMSDIKLEIDPNNIENSRIRILYRNYKKNLRNAMIALDPAENLGMFRVRYIPFAVIGEELIMPFQDDKSTVFEIGLTFGDKVISGDEFVKPELSIKRLGVAFAITPRLFNEDAEILALALTYDFNSFGSIAVGANFPQNKTGYQSYISFGINKEAFRMVLTEIPKLFN